MQRTRVAVYGAGGFGREVAWLAEQCSTSEQLFEVVCFVEDNPALVGQTINGLPVLDLSSAKARFPDAVAVAGIGSPQVRQKVVDKVSQAGFTFATLVHPRIEHSQWIEIGPGTVICAGNILTVNIKIGRQVQINLDCTIGHDVIMGDYTTLAPGVHVSGWVYLGQRVYVGTGATIINGTEHAPLTIGDDAIIGAGAVVTRAVPAATTVVGVPARAVQKS